MLLVSIVVKHFTSSEFKNLAYWPDTHILRAQPGRVKRISVGPENTGPQAKMCNQTRERRIAEALHTLVNEFVAPLFSNLVDPERKIDVMEAALTKKQAAVALGNVSTRTINRLIEQKKLLATGSGNKVLVARSEIERYLRANTK